MELLLDFFEAPDRALATVVEQRPIRSGVSAFAAGGASLLFATGLFQPLPALRWLPWAIALWGGFKLLSGYLTASVVHFIVSKPKDDRGPLLFVLLGYSELVWTLLVPIGLICLAVRWGVGGWLFFFIALEFWSFWLKIRSVRDLYEVPTFKALAAVSASYGLFAAAFLAGVTVWVWGFGALVMGFFS
jgi:hypothetical protein